VGTDVCALAYGVPTAAALSGFCPIGFAHIRDIRVSPPTLPCSSSPKRVLNDPTEALYMPATLIEYDFIKAGPEMADVKRALNAIGRRGFQICHTRTSSDGVYTFILSKDTGRNAEGEEEPAGGEWIDDGFVNEETSWT
jgi:hypothetical protein